MLEFKKRGYIRKYKYGGTGIFDSLANLGAKLFTRDIANRIASSALDVGKSVAKEGAKKALEAGKTAAVDAASGLVKRALNRKSRKILRDYEKLPVTSVNNTEHESISSLIDGSGNKVEDKEKKEKIEKIIKKLKRGSGIKKTK